jgi:hypothetical protein
MYRDSEGCVKAELTIGAHREVNKKYVIERLKERKREAFRRRVLCTK